jgi:hypothetical protein
VLRVAALQALVAEPTALAAAVRLRLGEVTDPHEVREALTAARALLKEAGR